ncbi:MAG: UDP-3-O-(3-hydroxymyristoyl)glucosamine N-acyltransferase [Planctomycetota bacterium]
MMTVAEIAALIGCTTPPGAESERVVRAPNTLEHAGPDEVALLGSQRYVHLLETTGAGVVIAADSVELPTRAQSPVVLRVADAEAAFHSVVRQFAPPRATGVHPSAVVDASVVMGSDCYIGPNCYVGPGTILGDRVTLQANVVIGTDGFGYRWDGSAHVRVPHLGHVEIGDDVEIGANTCIDRSKYAAQPTVIGTGTKIDNLVQIAHNVRIGKHCIIVSGTGIAGSTTVGDGVVFAAHVSVRDHITIGDGAAFSARAAIAQDVPPGAHLGGMPAVNHRNFLRTAILLEKLPQMFRDIKALKNRPDE